MNASVTRSLSWTAIRSYRLFVRASRAWVARRSAFVSARSSSACLDRRGGIDEPPLDRGELRLHRAEVVEELLLLGRASSTSARWADRRRRGRRRARARRPRAEARAAPAGGTRWGRIVPWWACGPLSNRGRRVGDNPAGRQRVPGAPDRLQAPRGPAGRSLRLTGSRAGARERVYPQVSGAKASGEQIRHEVGFEQPLPASVRIEDLPGLLDGDLGPPAASAPNSRAIHHRRPAATVGCPSVRPRARAPHGDFASAISRVVLGEGDHRLRRAGAPRPSPARARPPARPDPRAPRGRRRRRRAATSVRASSAAVHVTSARSFRSRQSRNASRRSALGLFEAAGQPVDRARGPRAPRRAPIARRALGACGPPRLRGRAPRRAGACRRSDAATVWCAVADVNGWPASSPITSASRPSASASVRRRPARGPRTGRRGNGSRPTRRAARADRATSNASRKNRSASARSFRQYGTHRPSGACGRARRLVDPARGLERTLEQRARRGGRRLGS